MPPTSFICSHYSGYATNRANLLYTSIWTDFFKTAGEIMFYGSISEPRSIRNVVDVDISRGDTIAIGVYPHNARDLFAEILKPENRGNIEMLVAELRHKYPDRAMVTIDLELMEEVTVDSFSHFSPGCLTKELGYVGFIFFDADSVEKAFPTIFVMEWRDNEDQIRTFPIQTWCSRWIFPTVGEPTYLGKQISFMLINSTLKGEFKGVTPSVKSMNFPSMSAPKVELRNVKALEAFVEESGVKNIKRMGDKVVDMTPEEPTQPATVFYGSEDSKTLADSITTEVINKGFVSFSNMISLGVFETVTLIGKTEKPVEVHMDFNGYAKRMCIHEGFVYAIPYGEESSKNLENELGEFLVICTEENIPLVLHKSTVLH